MCENTCASPEVLDVLEDVKLIINVQTVIEEWLYKLLKQEGGVVETMCCVSCKCWIVAGSRAI